MTIIFISGTKTEFPALLYQVIDLVIQLGASSRWIPRGSINYLLALRVFKSLVSAYPTTTVVLQVLILWIIPRWEIHGGASIRLFHSRQTDRQTPPLSDWLIYSTTDPRLSSHTYYTCCMYYYPHTLEKSPLKPHFEFIVFPGNPRRSSLLEGRTSMCPINQIHHHGHGRPRWWAGHLIQLGLIPLISGNQLLMDKI